MFNILVTLQRADEDLDSDELDEDSDADVKPEASATATSSAKIKPKTKKEIAAEVKLTAKEKLAAKKKAKKDGTYRSDDEDGGAFSAPSKGAPAAKLPIGSMTNCASCKKKFPVVSTLQSTYRLTSN